MMLARSPTASQIDELGQVICVSGLLLPGAVATSVQVPPPSVVRRSRPPAPTVMHVALLVQAIENMSLFDGNQVAPPSLLLKNVFTAPQAPEVMNLPYQGVAPDALPTAKQVDAFGHEMARSVELLGVFAHVQEKWRDSDAGWLRFVAPSAIA